MASTATTDTRPDFTDMTLQGRSLWLLELLRMLAHQGKLRGKVVQRGGKRWFQLEQSGSFPRILTPLATTLTKSQIKTTSEWLGKQKLRASENRGNNGFVHFILLGDEAEQPATPAPTNSSRGIDDDLADAARVVQAARKTIADLTSQLTAAHEEIRRLTAEKVQAAEETPAAPAPKTARVTAGKPQSTTPQPATSSLAPVFQAG